MKHKKLVKRLLHNSKYGVLFALEKQSFKPKYYMYFDLIFGSKISIVLLQNF